ncbi:MAG TPA: HEAT repeat domain-containing protein [Pyrinomonadaceae bacterium]|jgi:HEAT repeat protein
MSRLNALTLFAATLTLGAVFCRPAPTAAAASGTWAAQAGAGHPDFISVDGSNLNAKMASAVKRARAAGRQTPFWTAFATEIRPGVRADENVRDLEVMLDAPAGAPPPAAPSAAAPPESGALAFFLLRGPEGAAVTRVEVYDLDKRRDFGGHPVYWLGRVSGAESLGFFQTLVEANGSPQVAQRSVTIIALHADPGAPSLLRRYAQGSADGGVRGAAILGLGQVGGEEAFLAGLVRDEREPVESRKRAALALGIDRDRAALASIQRLYEEPLPPEVKKHLIAAASLNQNRDEAAVFLAGVARSGAGLELRKQAVLWLGLRTGGRGLEVLSQIVNSPDADTELQKHAVLARSLSGAKESKTLLTTIAGTHPKPAVRRQAVLWLSQGSIRSFNR